MIKKLSAVILILCLIGLTAAGCSGSGSNANAVTNLPKPDMTKWQYNEDSDLYYQVGLAYCETPADETYEKFAVFVPSAYMDATDNGDGTFTCELNKSGSISGYTAESAPIALPLFTPGYAASEALDEKAMEQNPTFLGYIKEFVSQGFVFIHAGCRGLAHGAPAGVADLKAVVRYLRYCDDVLAGDAQSIFALGMSGGGAQSAILGASGDSTLYDPYLEKIGAVQGVSDAVAGAMAWCPVCDLNTADAAYEWMMGCTRSGQSETEREISDRLAAAYADYVNGAGFTDENGKELTLTESADGIFQAGSYYDYIKSVIERSLNNYLSDTKFVNGSAQDYIDGLNADKKWITYDESTNTASITSVADFVKACKTASDLPLAFDQLPGNNTLFGYGDGEGSHFDRILADILTEIKSEYASDYTADLAKTDFAGNTVEQRVDMYAPLYYLLKSQKGYGTSTVAKYWRIRSGIKQKTNALTTEVNLALALSHCDGVKSVDFETVWEKDHEEAERTGSSVENYISWVGACMNDR